MIREFLPRSWFSSSEIPDPGVKEAPDPGSGFATMFNLLRAVSKYFFCFFKGDGKNTEHVVTNMLVVNVQ
jgi:hypothetical protein